MKVCITNCLKEVFKGEFLEKKGENYFPLAQRRQKTLIFFSAIFKSAFYLFVRTIWVDWDTRRDPEFSKINVAIAPIASEMFRTIGTTRTIIMENRLYSLTYSFNIPMT